MEEQANITFNVSEFFGLDGVKKNQLHEFSSYTYQISLGAVNRQQFNDASYMTAKNNQDQRWLVIGESGYTGINPTAETQGSDYRKGSRVTTKTGVPEYYVDNLKLTINMPGTGNSSTGLVGGSFDVFEPYSLGQLYESLLASAQLAGYTHFNQCTYVLKIEFKGYNTAGNPSEQPIEGTTRYFPIAFNNITFSADGSGSQYNCSFMQASDQYMANSYAGDIGTGITFTGVRSLSTTLQNLAAAMNKKETTSIEKEGNKALADEYIIEYVTESLGENGKKYRWTAEPFINTWSNYHVPNPTYFNLDDKNAKGKLQNFKDFSQFSYSSTLDKKTNLIQVIEDVMCHTNIATEALNNASIDGMTQWWTVTMKMLHKDPTGPIDTTTGLYPQKFVYTIRPYRRRLDPLAKPGANLKDATEVTSTIKRAYSYIYTGENEDVVDFKMNYDLAFFIAGQPKGFAGKEENDNKLIKTETGYHLPTPGFDDNALAVVPGTYGYRADVHSMPNAPGGIGNDAVELQVARWANAALTGITNGSQSITKSDYMQLKLDLTIIGDPYFMPVGGVGNQEYVDEGMAWQGQEVRIFMAFKNIVDYPYPGSSLPRIDSQEYHPFSGVYRIIRAVHNFNEGVYTTKLHLRKDLSINNQLVRRDRSTNAFVTLDATQRDKFIDLVKVLQADFDMRSDLEGLTLGPKGKRSK
jgi:hypothetical protein